MFSLEQVREEALKLSPNERSLLAEELLLSVGTSTNGERERLWAEEIKVRIDALDRGEMETISIEESRRRLFGS